MDPNSPADTELSVTLSPPLREWLGERSEALGIPPAVLLEQLLEAHRDVAERDGDVSTALEELVDVDAAVETALDERQEIQAVETLKADISGLTGRVDELDAKLTNNVEDLRKRVLQLRDSMEEQASKDHSHEEFATFSEQISAIETDVESVVNTVEEAESIHERLDTVDEKLDRLARVIVTLQRENQRNARNSEALNQIKRTAHEAGTQTADCGSCETSVRLSLLTEPACPHCDRRFTGLEPPNSRFGWFETSTLTVTDQSDTEAESNE